MLVPIVEKNRVKMLASSSKACNIDRTSYRVGISISSPRISSTINGCTGMNSPNDGPSRVASSCHVTTSLSDIDANSPPKVYREVLAPEAAAVQCQYALEI
ncbi:MAG: hypothetical protein U1F34_04285 [Gammaproteobacteria bacterium]